MSAHRLAKAVRAALDASPEQRALRFGDDWYSWGQLDRAGRELIASLDAAGVKSHAPIALVVRNRPSSYAALLALIAAERAVHMIYSYQSADAIAADVRRRDLAAVVAEAADWTAPLRAAAAERGCCGIALDAQLCGAAAVDGLDRVGVPAAGLAEAPQIVLLTSGTTGQPKPCALSYDAVAGTMLGESMIVPKTGESGIPSTLLYYSLGNVSGLYGMIPSAAQQRTAMLVEKFTLESWVDFVRSYRPESVTIPTVGIRMVLEAAVPKADLASLKFVWSGAAPLPLEVHEAFEERYGVPILIGYGATEFGGAVTSMTLEDRRVFGREKLASIGRPWRQSRLRIVDAETGTDLGIDRVGLIEVQAPAIGPHWIRTTDLGRIDADGFIFHCGRADGAINRGGFKIHPQAVEQVLALHPAVAAAAVVGLPDERLGEVPVAAVELRRGSAEPPVAELEQLARRHLTAVHVPVEIRIVPSLPRTQSMKVSIPDVKRLFAKRAPQ